MISSFVNSHPYFTLFPPNTPSGWRIEGLSTFGPEKFAWQN